MHVASLILHVLQTYTSPDAYIWGIAKTAFFKWIPQTIHYLKDAVRAFFANLRQPLFYNITRNLEHRYEVCLERGGAHLEQGKLVFVHNFSKLEVIVDSYGMTISTNL